MLDSSDRVPKLSEMLREVDELLRRHDHRLSRALLMECRSELASEINRISLKRPNTTMPADQLAVYSRL